jgi:hypothetical protein
MWRLLLYRIWLMAEGPISLWIWNTAFVIIGAVVVIPIVWATKRLGE